MIINKMLKCNIVLIFYKLDFAILNKRHLMKFDEPLACVTFKCLN